MSRTPRPLHREQMVIATLKMIQQHIDRACPTRRDIMEWTGVPRRHVWKFLAELEARGLIEVEVKGADPDCPAVRHRRRFRLAGGKWTGWTARPGRVCRKAAA